MGDQTEREVLLRHDCHWFTPDALAVMHADPSKASSGVPAMPPRPSTEVSAGVPPTLALPPPPLSAQQENDDASALDPDGASEDGNDRGRDAEDDTDGDVEETVNDEMWAGIVDALAKIGAGSTDEPKLAVTPL